jgi:hypothetical protein
VIVVIVLRATASERTIDHHLGRGYEAVRQADATKENSKYISSQQVGHAKPKSAVKRDVATMYQVAYLDSADFNGAYDCITPDKVHSGMLFTYGKRRTKDSYKDKSQSSEGLTLEHSGFDNSKKISSSSRHNSPWNRRLPRKYLAIKQKQNPYHSMDNQFEEHWIKGTIVDNGGRESNPDENMYDKDGQNAVEDIPQDPEGRKVLDDNKYIYDEGYDDAEDNGVILNDFGPEGQESVKSDASNRGHQAIYQQKYSVRRVPIQGAILAKAGDRSRSYGSGSGSRSPERWSEDEERTRNRIQSRIDQLKAKAKRRMARKFDSFQNARVPYYDSLADCDVK